MSSFIGNPDTALVPLPYLDNLRGLGAPRQPRQPRPAQAAAAARRAEAQETRREAVIQRQQAAEARRDAAEDRREQQRQEAERRRQEAERARQDAENRRREEAARKKQEAENRRLQIQAQQNAKKLQQAEQRAQKEQDRIKKQADAVAQREQRQKQASDRRQQQQTQRQTQQQTRKQTQEAKKEQRMQQQKERKAQQADKQQARKQTQEEKKKEREQKIADRKAKIGKANDKQTPPQQQSTAQFKKQAVITAEMLAEATKCRSVKGGAARNTCADALIAKYAGQGIALDLPAKALRRASGVRGLGFFEGLTLGKYVPAANHMAAIRAMATRYCRIGVKPGQPMSKGLAVQIVMAKDKILSKIPKKYEDLFWAYVSSCQAGPPAGLLRGLSEDLFNPAPPMDPYGAPPPVMDPTGYGATPVDPAYMPPMGGPMMPGPGMMPPGMPPPSTIAEPKGGCSGKKANKPICLFYNMSKEMQTLVYTLLQQIMQMQQQIIQIIMELRSSPEPIEEPLAPLYDPLMDPYGGQQPIPLPPYDPNLQPVDPYGGAGPQMPIPYGGGYAPAGPTVSPYDQSFQPPPYDPYGGGMAPAPYDVYQTGGVMAPGGGGGVEVNVLPGGFDAGGSDVFGGESDDSIPSEIPISGGGIWVQQQMGPNTYGGPNVEEIPSGDAEGDIFGGGELQVPDMDVPVMQAPNTGMPMLPPPPAAQQGFQPSVDPFANLSLPADAQAAILAESFEGSDFGYDGF